MVRSSTDVLFTEDLNVILFLTESDSFNESLECASMVTHTSSEMHTERLETHWCTVYSKTYKTSQA